MKRFTFMAAALAATIMISCGSNNSNNQSGDAEATASADTKSGDIGELTRNYANEGKEIVLEGYLLPGSFTMIRGNKMNVGLYKKAGTTSSSEQFCDVEIKYGDGKNSMMMPEEYSNDDIEIFDAEGASHGYRTKFKVTGTIKFTEMDWAEDTVFKANSKLSESANNIRRQSTERKMQAAQKRLDETGDQNDYSFEVKVTSLVASEE